MCHSTRPAILAERCDDGMRDLKTGRRLSEIIPAGFSWAGSHDHGPARFIRYAHNENPADTLIVITQKRDDR